MSTMVKYSTKLRLPALLALLCQQSRSTVAFAPNAFFRKVTTTSSMMEYRSPATTGTEEENGAPLSMDVMETLFYDSNNNNYQRVQKVVDPPVDDPSLVEFVALEALKSNVGRSESSLESSSWISSSTSDDKLAESTGVKSHFPFAAMMQGSAAYIANHAGKIAVFHLPGDILANKATSDPLLQDIALCWLLGMKIVIVTASRYAAAGECSTDKNDSFCINMNYPHECHNALKVTNRATLRLVEEEAGFLRTEMERKLNRCLRAHGGTSGHEEDSTAPPEGNVVSGNFYTAQRFGMVRGKDYEYTGFAAETHTKNIRHVLDKNDVVLLSTVGLSPLGELVNVNGYHLAATVAASLEASKVIYISNQGSVLQNKSDRKLIQELPLSFAQSIAAYHQVVCSNMGFATFQKAKEHLDPSAVELLLHMAWSSWAVEHGAKRAHIVNPGDGALLEELFTANNGSNTCIFHDDELLEKQAEAVDDDLARDWDAFFETASAQGQAVAYLA